MILNIDLQENSFSYDIILEKGSLGRINEYLSFSHERKVLIITDDGVPSTYCDILCKQIKNPFVYIIKQGEASKNIDNYQKIISYMIENTFTRKDAIIALGGGVVGDLSAFIASTYMRGIDFYNIPTTLLACVDSSIGGKTAIDFMNYKNIIGSFFQPKKVIIDPDTLLTLDKRQLHSGLVEAVKMAILADEELFDIINNSSNIYDDLENIIYKSLLIKKDVVQKDCKETNLRKILNFGHTIGHAIESLSNMTLLHGECVGIGMLYMCGDKLKDKLTNMLIKYNIPIQTSFLKDDILSCIEHDKKADGNKIDIVYCETVGEWEIRKVLIEEIKAML